jgi:hypothetical protein
MSLVCVCGRRQWDYCRQCVSLCMFVNVALLTHASNEHGWTWLLAAWDPGDISIHHSLYESPCGCPRCAVN